MWLLLRLTAWSLVMERILTSCVSRLRTDGVGSIVGQRMFANGSLGVVDDYARYMIFNNAGSLIYKENLNLPNDPQRSSKYRLVFAIIDNSNSQLYLISSSDKSFTYASGNVVQSGNSDYEDGLTWGSFLNFQDFGVGMVEEGPGLYQVVSSKVTLTNRLSTVLGLNPMFNKSYVSRASANPLLNEFNLAIFSNRTFIGRIDQTNKLFVPAGSAAASAVVTEPSFFVITSSIGTNAQYIAFAGYYPWSASNVHGHYLKIKQRGSSLSATLQIRSYHIWSVALSNTTVTKMYFLTHDGSLYSTTFSTSSISVPTLLVQDLYLRYADLEIITPTKLLLRTIDTMAIFDIATSTLQIVVDIKPTGARHFGSKMFVLTHNFNVSLYDLTGNLPVRDTAFTYTGKVTQLIVSTVYNRFYMLTTGALYTFSLTTYAQLAAVTLVQIKTMISATSLISLNDIAPLALQPSKIMIIAYGVYGGSQDTAMVVLRDNDLVYVNHFWSGYLDNFLTLTIGVGPTGAYDIIMLFRPDVFNTFEYYTSNTFNNTNYRIVTRYYEDPFSPETENMRNVLFVAIPSGDKQPPRTDMMSDKVIFPQVEGQRVEIYKRTISTTFWNWYFYANWPKPPNMLVQRLGGHLNQTIVYSGQYMIYIMYPDFNSYHLLFSEEFTGGVGYQKSDDTIVFFNGEYEISRINPLECYADPTKGYQYFDTPCDVANCLVCNAFYRSKCAICVANRYLSVDNSSCLSTCNPGYLLNGMCYNNCPIEYYKYNAALNTCETRNGCTVTKSKLIFGDMCNSVASCPTGSTVNASKFCTFPTNKAASPTSTALVNNPCPGGQIYLTHFSMCVSSSNTFYSNYTVSAGVMYCDSTTHYYDVASKRCLQTCGLYSAIHPQMGQICVSAANCNSLNMLTDDTTAGVKLCVVSCSPSLWTNLVASSCNTDCPYPSTYAQISDRTCISSCGATVFTLETNKSCLTSAECLTAGMLKTPSSKFCTLSCAVNLYLKASSSECLTSAECTSVSLLLSTSDMKCVAACSGSQYLLASTNQCLTAAQCMAVSSGSGGGLLSEVDKKCVASCSASQFIATPTSQCLTSTQCTTATLLMTPSTKTCSSTCGPSLYLKSSSSECLTGSECTASSLLLSTVDMKCVSACSGTQYLHASTSQCLTATQCKAISSGSGGGLLSEDDRKCVPTCSASQYIIISTSQCLTSAQCLASTLLKTPSTMACSAACGASLYLKASSSECLTSTECASSSMLLSTSDMKCVTTCSGTQYLLASANQCLTAAQCKAVSSGSGGGLLSEDDKKCVSACGTAHYILTTTSQCLTSAMCKAVPSGSGGGLLSEGDKKCVGICNSTQFVLPATSQCLTEAACLATSGYGKLSMYDRKCVSGCGTAPQQYLSSVTSKCWQSLECLDSALGNGVPNNVLLTCDNSCSTGLYRLVLTSECLTPAACKTKTIAEGGSLLSEENMLCVSSCTSSQYYLASTSQCLSSISCLAAFGGTGYLDEASKTCVSSCSGTQYKLTSSRQCLSSSECLAAYGGAGLLSEGDHLCVSSCGTGQYLLALTSQCLTAPACKAKTVAEGGSILSEEDMKCVNACSASQYYLAATSQCLSSTLCQAAFVGTGHLDEVSKTCTSSCSATQYELPSSRQCLSNTQCLAAYSGTGLMSEVDHHCVSSCSSTQYLLAPASQCLTASACKAKTTGEGGSLLSEEDMKCVNACTPTQYYLTATSQCLSPALCQAAFGNTGYLDEVSQTCVSTCPGTQYKLTSTRQCITSTQCLASNSGTGLLSENDKQCVSSCGSAQFLLESSKQCLTPPECLASNGGTGLLSPQDKKCVSACLTTQYLEQATKLCLSSAECNSLYTGTGLLNTRDRTCVTNCPADLYYLAATQQCLTAGDCHTYSGNTGLTSSSDMKCLTNCQSDQYLLVSNKECLTASACKAYSGSSGLLSESDMTCLLTCQPSQYLLQSTRQCLMASECLNSGPVGGFLSDSDMKCLDECTATQYLVEESNKCVSEADCWTMDYLVTPSSKLCQSSCLTNEYKDQLSHYCYTKAECSSLTMLTKSSSPNSLCISACSASDYLDSEQTACLTKSACTNDLGKFIITSNRTCVDSCPSNIPFIVDHECHSACPTSYFLEESTLSCVQHCPEATSNIVPSCCLRYLDFKIVGVEPADRDSVVVILEVYFESNSTSTVTSFSVELATLFKQVGIVTDTSNNASVNLHEVSKAVVNDKHIELEFTPSIKLEKNYLVRVFPESNVEFIVDQYRSTFRPQPKNISIAILPPKPSEVVKIGNSNGVWTNLGKTIAQILAATKLLTPLMMTTFMNARSGSFLCLIVQTYTKLMMLTRLNFKLEINDFSVMYYDVFQEFLDTFNEDLMRNVVGDYIVDMNKKYVCDYGFEKLCFLTVEDNFFMSHMLALLILASEALVVFLLAKVCQMLRYKSVSDLLLYKLKNLMIYAFILENSIEFWFTLLLNALIFVYRIAVLAVLKIGGHIFLVVMLVFLIKLLRHKPKSIDTLKQGVASPSSKVHRVVDVVFERLRAIVKETTVENRADIFLKSFLLHDFVFAVVLVPGKYLGGFQMMIWLIFELTLLIVISKYRPFSKKVYNVRQIVIEALFLTLLLFMTLVPFQKSGNYLLSILILIFSMLILIIDFVFVVVEFVKVTIELVKSYLKKKRRSPQSAHRSSNLISYRADSIGSLRTVGKLSNRSLESRGSSEFKFMNGSTSSNNKTRLRELKDLKVQNKGSTLNRIVPTQLLERSSSLRNIEYNESHLQNEAQEGTSTVMQPLKNTLRIRSTRMLTLQQKSGTTTAAGSAHHIESLRSVHVRVPKLSRRSLVDLNQPTDSNVTNQL